jgi:hypothetical protein
MRRLPPCKRDALPAELTAHASGMAAFRPFLKQRFAGRMERSGNARHQTVPRVPTYSRSGLSTPCAGEMVG